MFRLKWIFLSIFFSCRKSVGDQVVAHLISDFETECRRILGSYANIAKVKSNLTWSLPEPMEPNIILEAGAVIINFGSGSNGSAAVAVLLNFKFWSRLKIICYCSSSKVVKFSCSKNLNIKLYFDYNFFNLV